MIRANKAKNKQTIFNPDRAKAKSFYGTQLTHSVPMQSFSTP